MRGTSQALRRALPKLVGLLDSLDIPHMLIGGWALPVYGHIRATLDLDIAVVADFPQIRDLHRLMSKSGYQLPSASDERAPMFVAIDRDNIVEMEIWTKPDGLVFDEELLRRRLRVRPFGDSFEMFAVGPEDFIVNKLARSDRGRQDEQDVASVLQRWGRKLDRGYLTARAERARVLPRLRALSEEET